MVDVRSGLLWFGLTLVIGMRAPGAFAEESGTGPASPGFGGPNATENLLLEDAVRDWKSRLRSERGISLGLDYTSNAFHATKSLGEKDAWGGMARFYGSWELANRGEADSGAFVWKVEHRHRISDIPPVALASELGYAGLIAPPFSDQKLRFTNLFWRQKLNAGRTTLLAGFLDVTDYLDVFALASPWTGFSNFAFSTGTQTIPIPNDATLGVAVGSMLTERAFLIAGLADTNSDPTDLGETAESFFEHNEYFTSVELGMTPSQDRIYLDNRMGRQLLMERLARRALDALRPGRLCRRRRKPAGTRPQRWCRSPHRRRQCARFRGALGQAE